MGPRVLTARSTSAFCVSTTSGFLAKSWGELRLTLSDRYGAPADVVDLRTADAVLRRKVIVDAEFLHATHREIRTELVARTLIVGAR